MPAGRPPKWSDPKELEELVDGYIEHCKENDEFAHKTGLAIHIGCDRETIDTYLSDKGEEFSSAIKKMLRFSEHQGVKSLHKPGNKSIPGTIFLMKNLHKYSDKVETESNVNVTKHEVDRNIQKLQETEEGRELLTKMYEQLKK